MRPARGLRRSGRAAVIVIVVLALAGGGGALWYFVLRTPPPAAVVETYVEALKAGDNEAGLDTGAVSDLLTAVPDEPAYRELVIVNDYELAGELLGVVRPDSDDPEAVERYLVDLLVGDLDSISPEGLAAAEDSGIRIERHAIDKDATDLELSLAAAVRHGAGRIGEMIDPLIAQALERDFPLVLLLAGQIYGPGEVEMPPSSADYAFGAFVRIPLEGPTSDLVGLILAFVGAVQLMMFGAQIYVADLVGIAMVRVMGAVMVGIVMAGRTGAAFAAQLGTMQGNEEIDALKTMGVSPMEFLVLPRMLALVLMMPLLCVYADLMAVIGGLIVGVGVLDIGLVQYINQTTTALKVSYFFIGIIHATVFGVLVALAGCLRGIQCGRSASAVGEATTSAVVTSIVAIIVATGIITVVCNVLGI